MMKRRWPGGCMGTWRRDMCQWLGTVPDGVSLLRGRALKVVTRLAGSIVFGGNCYGKERFGGRIWGKVLCHALNISVNLENIQCRAGKSADLLKSYSH